MSEERFDVWIGLGESSHKGWSRCSPDGGITLEQAESFEEWFQHGVHMEIAQNKLASS